MDLINKILEIFLCGKFEVNLSSFSLLMRIKKTTINWHDLSFNYWKLLFIWKTVLSAHYYLLLPPCYQSFLIVIRSWLDFSNCFATFLYLVLLVTKRKIVNRITRVSISHLVFDIRPAILVLYNIFTLNIWHCLRRYNPLTNNILLGSTPGTNVR